MRTGSPMTDIVLEFVYPPIPIRSMDWQATWDDYDVDCDEDGFYSIDPSGSGATPEEAIENLIHSTRETHVDDGRIEGNGTVTGDSIGGFNYA